MAGKTKKEVKPQSSLGRRSFWTYSLGGIGRDMSYALYSNYLLTFILFTKNLTDGQFAAISTIMVVCRIWDAVNDPVMGVIIENTHTKFGKFKPWIMIGVITNSVVLVTLFSSRLSGWGFVVFFAIMYLLWDITYTMNDISYWSMMPALTSNMKERNNLSSAANLFAGLGSILTMAFVPMLTAGENTIGGDAITGYTVVTVFIAICFIGCQTMTCAGVKEHNRNVKSEESVGLKKLVKIIFKNDQLLWVALVMLVYNLGGAIITGLGTNYIYFQYGYDGSLVTTFVILFGAASGIIMALYPFLSARFTRQFLLKIAITMVVTGYLAIFVAAFFSASFYILCAMGLIIGLGQSTFYMVITINIANTVEYNEWKTGSRNEGIIFSIRPFMAKMGSALQSLVVMIVYLALGVTNITNAISDAENSVSKGLIDEAQKLEQIEGVLAAVPENTTLYMRACMVFVPIVLMLAAYIILKKKCTIDEKKYDAMLADIAAKKQAQEPVNK